MERWPGLLVALCLLGLLTGCTSTLKPLSRPAEAGCGLADEGCLSLGERQFAAYREAKLEQVLGRSRGYRLPGLPSAWLHERRTEYAVLLIHGLNDSAYYMQDIAGLLYRQGFNVLTLLLPGHGTDPQDMLGVTAEQWRAEVERGLEMTALVGRQVIVGGFSLGGVLCIDALLRRPQIRGLLLFSPALKLNTFNAVSGLSCVPAVADLTVETKLAENPVKYKYRSGNSVCQLVRLMESNLRNGTGEGGTVDYDRRLRDLGRRIRVPTFIALTYQDARIEPEAVVGFAGEIRAPVLLATFGRREGGEPRLANAGEVVHITDAALPHSFLVRRSNPYNGQQNPSFERMAEVLTGFLARQFPAAPVLTEPVSP